MLTLGEEVTIPINGKPIYEIFTPLVPYTMLRHHLKQPPQIRNTNEWAPHSFNVPHPIQQLRDDSNELRPGYVWTQFTLVVNTLA